MFLRCESVLLFVVKNCTYQLFSFADPKILVLFFEESFKDIFFSLELIGKYPSETEVSTYSIDRNLPVFMCVKKDQDTSSSYKEYLSKTNDYFANQYRM